jgi:serpin B
MHFFFYYFPRSIGSCAPIIVTTIDANVCPLNKEEYMKHCAVILMLLFVSISCKHNDPVSPIKDPPKDITAFERSMISADNSFGFKLFSTVNNAQANQNVIISPFSISMAFGMLLNGAHGTTLDSLEQALGKSGLSTDDINASYQSISGTLTNLDPSVNFQIANSIWYRNDFSVLPKFLSDNQTYFDAEVTSLNFASADAVTTINNWVNTKTNGKIPTILTSIPDNVVMYLINAIYFKGTWTYQFNTQNTADAPFTCSNQSTVTCKMMSQKSTFAYYADSTMQAIDMPYGSGAFSMTIILPNTNTSIDQFAASLTEMQWNAVVNHLDSTTVNVYLPKFKLEYKRTLNSDLCSLGMGIAFTEFADFSRISTTAGLCISEVLHKTFIEVNEEGTEAAAVTAIGVGVTSVGPVITPTMLINHPFIFAIRDHQSGTMLFIGKIVNPNS